MSPGLGTDWLGLELQSAHWLTGDVDVQGV
jgi:hypothetical protein